MKTKKVLSLKQSENKEKIKRDEKIFFGKDKIDPSIYLSYYTLNSMSLSQRMIMRSTDPSFRISNNQNTINHPRPQQRLVEDLLLSKKCKKPKKLMHQTQTIILNKTIESKSLSKHLLKNGDLKSPSRRNTNTHTNTNTNTNTHTHSNTHTDTNRNSMQTTMINEQSNLIIKTESPIILPKIQEVYSNVNNQKSSQERSNSITSLKSNRGNKRRSSKNMNYVEFLSSMKNRKNSKFTTRKSYNGIDASCDLYNIENRIVSDFIGKTYVSQTSDDGFSCFFSSTGNFHSPLFNVFGVVEGNGRHGRQISSLTRSNLHTYLTSGITYGFKNSKVSEYEIYESLIKNNFEPIRFVDERIHDDVIKSNLDLETSGVSITVVFIICKKLICINVGDVRAVAFLRKKENGKEILQSKVLSTLDVKKDENNNTVLTNALGNKSKSFTGVPSYFWTDITDDYMYIIIASKHFWDSMTYGNVFKFMSTIQTDNIISKAERIIDFKQNQNILYNRRNAPYSFCLIEL